jgi:glyoxylase-like metal-dependent hydrolase (beta-lactamase superfamily II)
MEKSRIITIDLNFQNRMQTIASYLIRGHDSVVLIESGPGSTLSALEAGLAKEGLSPRDVTHVLLTHIHLDHAGAAGWLSRQGAQIYVHPNGAPHLLNPEKLIASATRIYGDRMETLWGEFLPVAEDRLTVPQNIIIHIYLKMYVSAAMWAEFVFLAIHICECPCRRPNYILADGVRVLRVCAD